MDLKYGWLIGFDLTEYSVKKRKRLFEKLFCEIKLQHSVRAEIAEIYILSLFFGKNFVEAPFLLVKLYLLKS